MTESTRSPEGAMPASGTPGNTYTAQQKLAALRAYGTSGQPMRIFCTAQGISTATLCAWRRAFEAGGAEALVRQAGPRNPRGVSRRAYSPEERRAPAAPTRTAAERQDVRMQAP